MQGKVPYNYTEQLKSNPYKELCFCLILLITVFAIYIWCTGSGREFFDKPERAI